MTLAACEISSEAMAAWRVYLSGLLHFLTSPAPTRGRDGKRRQLMSALAKRGIKGDSASNFADQTEVHAERLEREIELLKAQTEHLDTHWFEGMPEPSAFEPFAIQPDAQEGMQWLSE